MHVKVIYWEDQRTLKCKPNKSKNWFKLLVADRDERRNQSTEIDKKALSG